MNKLIYTPSSPPTNDTDLKNYITTELLRLSTFLNNITNVPVSYDEPKSPEEGTLCTFPAGGFDPGSGAGTYIYRAGSWVLIV